MNIPSPKTGAFEIDLEIQNEDFIKTTTELC
jgi:hypothetical protein